MNKVFTAGYSGHTPVQLKLAAELHNAFVCDIRWQRRSMQPGWSEDELSALLGNRYLPLPALGNVNYKSSPIELHAAKLGCDIVCDQLRAKSIILLCGCAVFADCHRATVSRLLAQRGVITQELAWPELAAGDKEIKCLSLWQPYASLIALGAKRIETRSWATSYRGPLAIQAAKTNEGFEYCGVFRSKTEFVFHEPFRSVLRPHFATLGDLPRGAIVAVVELVDCKPSEELVSDLTAQERAFGDYSLNRFGWVLDNILALPAPVPQRGAQGLFNVPTPNIGVPTVGLELARIDAV